MNHNDSDIPKLRPSIDSIKLTLKTLMDNLDRAGKSDEAAAVMYASLALQWIKIYLNDAISKVDPPHAPFSDDELLVNITRDMLEWAAKTLTEEGKAIQVSQPIGRDQ